MIETFMNNYRQSLYSVVGKLVAFVCVGAMPLWGPWMAYRLLNGLGCAVGSCARREYGRVMEKRVMAIDLTERQRALMDVIRGLDPSRRHTLTITCRGSEPWRIERVMEHLEIELKPEQKN
jgi:hypothetical protein